MSNIELRQAATTLRERAEAATPGPWEVVVDDHGSAKRPVIEVSIWSKSEQAYVTEDVRVSLSGSAKVKSNADYIATMDSTLGLLLADVLDHAICPCHCGEDGKRQPYCFSCEDSGEDHDCPRNVVCDHTPGFNRTLAIARRINGTV